MPRAWDEFRCGVTARSVTDEPKIKIPAQAELERGTLRSFADPHSQLLTTPITNYQLLAPNYPLLSLPLIPRNHAIFNMNHSMRVLGDVVLVCDQHDRVSLGVQAIEQRHNFRARL